MQKWSYIKYLLTMTTCPSIADCFPCPLLGVSSIYMPVDPSWPGRAASSRAEHDDFTDKVSAKFTSSSVGGEGMNTFHPPDSEWVKISHTLVGKTRLTLKLFL
jgi:hypothetical protein